MRGKSVIPTAAVVTAAAAAATITGLTAPADSPIPAVQPAVFGLPMPSPASGRHPQAPAADVPTPDQVVGVISGIADPNVPASNKSGYVEGGLGMIERSVMDGRMRKGLENGKLPLTLSASNIQPDGPGAATADVTASSPKLTPHTVNLRFVDQDGWKLSHSSLTMLSQMSSN